MRKYFHQHQQLWERLGNDVALITDGDFPGGVMVL